ncbi:pep-1 [Hyphantria cunea granulovirus]|uniref:Pep-1 n=1 Tax=Hyphantria cunea granulovirus TaxID=307448 RepID=A0AAE5YIN2_9BBAC|nr:pep-1 [Hyphantria cunea granulovirus]QBQ01568.1 pep-1 [Hyphantria cunea granulovirus]
MATIPADSRAFIKPFEGVDVTCLINDVVAWFGFDEISSILNTNPCTAIKTLPLSQKAMWKDLEPQVHSEKMFITSLGVRLLIIKTSQHIETCSSTSDASTNVYYHNTPTDNNRHHHHLNHHHKNNTYHCEISCARHKLGNIFINEAIYDARAYPELEDIKTKINRIHDILLATNETVV